MPAFKSRRRLPHRADAMFDLVADVEKYPLFVPLCHSLKVRRRIDGQDGATSVLIADMTVAFNVLRETFTSRVSLDRPNLSILVEYVDGPFSHLENVWRFRDVAAGGSDVEFSIDYAFRSRALAIVMGAMFDTAFRRFADAFEARALAVYGRRDAALTGPATSPPST